MGSVTSTIHREPWNKGKIVGQKAPFKLQDIWALTTSTTGFEVPPPKGGNLSTVLILESSRTRATNPRSVTSRSSPTQHRSSEVDLPDLWVDAQTGWHFVGTIPRRTMAG
jgi:hypothetical protein